MSCQKQVIRGHGKDEESLQTPLRKQCNYKLESEHWGGCSKGPNRENKIDSAMVPSGPFTQLSKRISHAAAREATFELPSDHFLQPLLIGVGSALRLRRLERAFKSRASVIFILDSLT